MCRAGNLLESFSIEQERRKCLSCLVVALKEIKPTGGRTRKGAFVLLLCLPKPRRAKVSEENLFLIQISYLRDQSVASSGFYFFPLIELKDFCEALVLVRRQCGEWVRVGDDLYSMLGKHLYLHQ